MKAKCDFCRKQKECNHTLEDSMVTCGYMHDATVCSDCYDFYLENSQELPLHYDDVIQKEQEE